MVIENFIYNLVRPKSGQTSKKKSVSKIDTFLKYLTYILYIAIFFIALAVSWDCNKETKGICKYIMVIIAGMFDSVYLLYYLIYRILLGNKCY